MPTAHHDALVRSAVAAVAAAGDVLDAVPGAIDLLTDAERTRVARLREATDRRGYIAAHALVRLCCARMFAIPVTSTVVQRCDRCGGPHGRPRLLENATAGLSISRAGGVVAAAVAPTRIGIDIEPLDSAVRMMRIGHRICTPAERAVVAGAASQDRALLMLWVRKEALVKLGLATLDSMTHLDLSPLPPDPPPASRRLRWQGLSMVDLILAEPAAVGAVVGTCEIEVVPLAGFLPG